MEDSKTAEKTMPRLMKKYREDVTSKLKEKHNLTNVMEIPKSPTGVGFPGSMPFQCRRSGWM